MVSAKFFHANAVDKMPKITELLNNFLSELSKEDIISVNATEIGSPSKDAAYSYTVLIIYNSK
ncbi:MAG: hypothetical protein ACYC0V_03530 [Armatimonadota bacterium]